MVALFAALLIPFSSYAKPQRTQQGTLTSWFTLLQPMFAQIRLVQQFGQPTVSMRIKLVYAYTSEKKYVDPALRKDIPSLGLYDFNSYKLLKKSTHQIEYKRNLQVKVNDRYTIELSPQAFNKRQSKIAIRATFLRRRPTTRQKNRYVSYATTLFRLQNGGKVALMGPFHKEGRAMLILHAAHQP